MKDKINIIVYVFIEDWVIYIWIWLYVMVMYYCWSKGLINKWISSDNIWFIGVVLNYLMNIEFIILFCLYCILEYFVLYEYVKWLMVFWYDLCLYGEFKYLLIFESNCL